MERKYGYRSLIYRALIAWENLHLEKGTHGRIDLVNLSNKPFLHRIARNYIRHTMYPDYYIKLRDGIDQFEIDEIKRKIDLEIFEVYPELREGYNFLAGDYD